LALVFIFIVAMLWTPKHSLPAISYLPQDTVFYYQWSNQETFNQQVLAKLPIIDASIPQEQLSKLQQILLDGFGQAKEIVWFKVKDDSDDHYLVRFDKSRSILKWLQEYQIDYLFVEPGKNVILISHSASLVASADSGAHFDVSENDLGQGVNIYWSTQDSPQFLKNLSAWLKISTDNPHVYTNIKLLDSGKTSFNLWQDKLRKVINSTSTVTWPNDAQIPYNIDLALGFSSGLNQEEQGLIKSYILQPLFADLPYYKLGEKDMARLMQGNFILKNSDGWLMMSRLDWQSQAAALLPSFDLTEVKKVLPDGTAYIEYLASSTQAINSQDKNNQNVKQYDYRSHVYWKIGDLYGMELGGYYYLANQPSLLEKTIASQIKLANITQNCLSSQNLQVKDIIKLQAKFLTDGQIKQTLLDRGIEELLVFSYENNQIKGWQACF